MSQKDYERGQRDGNSTKYARPSSIIDRLGGDDYVKGLDATYKQRCDNAGWFGSTEKKDSSSGSKSSSEGTWETAGSSASSYNYSGSSSSSSDGSGVGRFVLLLAVILLIGMCTLQHYVRQELIPDELMAVYRERFETIYDRADLYVPFIERSLNLLEPGGTLGFICADRWMKNRYGGPLRAMVAKGFHLKCYVDMVDTAAFQSEVSAYPAITIITREKPGPTRLAHRPAIDKSTLRKLAASLASKTATVTSGVTEVAKVVNGSEPWI